ncbi:MAG: formamidopyrimidine-DNA glycosylase, partial [bacterium]|nr:formamidopyrimidine-DNA glycosylase [bacterium]
MVKTGELSNFFIREGTGPEPLEKDFILADFQALLAKKPTAKIKQFLMDPKNLAGIGNIYADEILFFAGVHPLRQIKSLKETDVKKIFKGTKDILRLAIKLKGTSASDYLDAFGQPGKFAAKLKAYGRKG